MMGERKRKHVCVVCQKAVQTKPAYVSHLLSHSEIRCSGCQETFTTSSSLQTHLLRHAQATCLICQQTCQLTSLKQHMMAAHATFMCGICRIILPSAAGLESHLLCHVDQKRDDEDSGSVCTSKETGGPNAHSDDSLDDSSINSLEVNFAVNSLPTACGLQAKRLQGDSSADSSAAPASTSQAKDEKPGFASTGNSDAESCSDNEDQADATCSEHKEICTNTKPDKDFSSLIHEVKQELNECAANSDISFAEDIFTESRDVSLKVEAEETVLAAEGDGFNSSQCRICKQEFSVARELKQHMKGHEAEKLYRCKICSSKFRFSVALRRHVSTHAVKDTEPTENAFKCYLCSIVFPSMRLLDQHNHVHTGRCPFRCNHCSQAFMKCHSLKLHVKGHRLKGRMSVYACSKCSKTFGTLVQLDKHVAGHLGDGAYQCALCEQRFNQTRTLHAHINFLHARGTVDCPDPFMCNECGESFSSMKSLEGHIHNHRATQPFHCNLCTQTFSDFNPLKAHIELHDTSGLTKSSDIVKCGICLKLFTSTFYLNSHVKRHLAQREYKCPLCGKRLVHARSLKLHMRSHTTHETHNCTVCLTTFKTKTALFVHFRMNHSEQMPHKCDQCGRGFFIKGRLQNHMLSHGGGRDFSCKECELGFDTEGAYQKHMWKSHGQRTRTFVCDICKRHLRTEHSLKEHYRTHTGEKPYMCDICGKCFTQRQMLTSHRRLHTGERPYKCKLCDETYVSNSYLYHHMKRSHLNERPFICEVCGNSYRAASQLKVHFRTHTGERPYVCKECGKTFNTGSTLHRHGLVHTGEKAHRCEWCGKSFGKPYTLKVHTRIHTGEAPYKCDVCDKAFRQKCSLQDHQKHHVKDVSEFPRVAKNNRHQGKSLDRVSSAGRPPRKAVDSTSVLFTNEQESVPRLLQGHVSGDVNTKPDVIRKQTVDSSVLFYEEAQRRHNLSGVQNIYESNVTGRPALPGVAFGGYQGRPDTDVLVPGQTESAYYWDVPSYNK